MKISACIIAKNEQDMLPRCLNSIHEWVDEIILVDTGSTDRTIPIAKQYGANVYSHPWKNDFSLHRNQSIDYATGDWILIIDCDEEIASDMSNIKERLDKIPETVSALVVTVNEIDKGEAVTSWLGIRFFRKSANLRYKNVVHNKAVYDGGCAGTDIKMNHYGYSLGKDKMRKKHDRTEKLLRARIDMDRKDPLPYYYMCQMRIGQKNYYGAEYWGLKFFENIKLDPQEFQHTSVMYYYMAWIYLHLKDGERAYAWTKKGLEFYPNDLDLNYIMGRIGYQSSNDDMLKKHAAIYFQLLPMVRNRGGWDSGKFENYLDSGSWYNRTTYTACEAAEKDMRKFMEAISD